MPRSPLQKRSEQNHPPAAPLSSKSCQANSLSLRVPFKGDHCSPLHPSGTHLGARGKASPLARPAPVCIQSSVRRKPPLARKDSARPFAWPGAECDKKGKATRSIARGHASPAGGGAPMPLSTASFPCKAGGEERSGRRELLALPVRLSRRLTARLRLARLPEKGSPPPEPFAGSWTHFRSPGYCLHQLHAPYRSPAALTLSPPKPLSENTTGGKSGKMPLQKTMSGVQRRREDPARGSKKTDRIMTSTPLLLNISIRSHCQILDCTHVLKALIHDHRDAQIEKCSWGQNKKASCK
ncbi:uncharacterized protein LOC143835599 isoform X3 [Paroedura picta]|uniref:uncharacterized protein LOC143835599 isoform X3 n=1 Tax=Paroedura picta TaxID=143630 RepID=UPI004055D908